MDFFNDFLDVPTSLLKYNDVKEIGMDFEWFSHIFNVTILVGTVKYKTYKNYRCKEEFKKYILENQLNIPTVIFIHDWHNEETCAETMQLFKNVDNLFIGKYKDVISKIDNKMIFQIKQPRLKKNGKSEKHFNIQRKKRFRINVINGQCSDNTIIKSTTISCNFPSYYRQNET